MFLLDTNALSELRKVTIGRCDRNVLAWAEATSISQMYLSSVVIFEIDVGILSIARRDPVQGAHLRTWLDGKILIQFNRRIIPVDTAVARCAARLQVPDRPCIPDALIAATAIVHGLTLVTRNVAEFMPAGVPVLDPWQPR